MTIITTNEPEKFIKKYFEYPDGRKEWCVTGDLGSVSFWVQENVSEIAIKWGEKFFGGVEAHYNAKSKPDYMGDEPHHKVCHQNGAECWHDGTSLWAFEHWIPYILPYGQERIWQELMSAYKSYMKKEEADAA